MTTTDLERQVCRVTDLLKPLSRHMRYHHRRDRLGDAADKRVSSGAAPTRQAASERWRMISMAER